MNLKQTIRRIIREEEDNQKILRADKLKNLRNEIGLKDVAELLGGYDKYLKIVYNDNIKEYFKNEDVKAIVITEGPNMYLDDLLVKSLNLEDFGKDEKILGKFGWGNKSKTTSKFPYSLDVRLRKLNYSDGRMTWRVVGIGGSYGFGYSFISKRETLGPRFRKQIFDQVINKYNLNDFIK